MTEVDTKRHQASPKPEPSIDPEYLQGYQSSHSDEIIDICSLRTPPGSREMHQSHPSTLQLLQVSLILSKFVAGGYKNASRQQSWHDPSSSLNHVSLPDPEIPRWALCDPLLCQI